MRISLAIRGLLARVIHREARTGQALISGGLSFRNGGNPSLNERTLRSGGRLPKSAPLRLAKHVGLTPH
jgi:hypothetical protein